MGTEHMINEVELGDREMEIEVGYIPGEVVHRSHLTFTTGHDGISSLTDPHFAKDKDGYHDCDQHQHQDDCKIYCLANLCFGNYPMLCIHYQKAVAFSTGKNMKIQKDSASDDG